MGMVAEISPSQQSIEESGCKSGDPVMASDAPISFSWLWSIALIKIRSHIYVFKRGPSSWMTLSMEFRFSRPRIIENLLYVPVNTAKTLPFGTANVFNIK
jgi:hypothetical protein